MSGWEVFRFTTFCKEDESESSLTRQQLRDGIYRAEEKTDTSG